MFTLIILKWNKEIKKYKKLHIKKINIEKFNKIKKINEVEICSGNFEYCLWNNGKFIDSFTSINLLKGV